MNAAEFNALYPVGTPVVAYPGCRPEDDANDERLVTRTRSKAEVLGGHTDVVWVDGHGACIALSHVDVSPAAEPITDLATAVEVMGALPMPAGPADHAPLKPLPSHLAAIGQAGSEYEQALYAAYLQAAAEVEQLRGRLDVVAEFVAKRAEYITAIENCHPNNGHDYNRWQGHAESRRQLAQQLGLPVAWPVKDEEAGR